MIEKLRFREYLGDISRYYEEVSFVTNQEIYDYYESIHRGSRGRTITDHFNSLTLDERKSYTDL